MEKIIWIEGNNRRDMIEAQRRINSMGSMRAFCMLTYDAVLRMINNAADTDKDGVNMPSLIILDYDTECQTDFAALSLIRAKQSLAGVPLFFMVSERNETRDEDCYNRGATVILTKPFSRRELLRIERTAWQYEVTKNYEKLLYKQAGDIQAAKEIMSLNGQLKARNELLYQIFGRYFSDKVLEVILESPTGAAIGGKRRDMTVLTSDLRGFTSISEELNAEAVTELLNCYFGKMVDIIGRYHGTVIEFLGDSVLAVFGAPIDSGYHADEAVAAAIEMQNSMEEVNSFADERGYPRLEMGIGLHTGEAFIGNIGSEKMMRYNVIGSIVNECSRIEGCTVGRQIFASDAVLSHMKCQAEVSGSYDISVKGLKNPMKIYEITGINGMFLGALVRGPEEVIIKPPHNLKLIISPVKDKRIGDEKVCAQLLKISDKRAMVCVSDLPDGLLELFSDVFISAEDECGMVAFSGEYAKLTDKSGDVLTLTFTHTEEDFKRYTEGRCCNEE